MNRNLEAFDLPAFQMGTPGGLRSTEVPSGVLTFEYGGAPLDVLHIPNESETTVVAFHAAMSARRTDLPIFAARRLTKELNCNFVSVSDPSLAREPVRLGWHIGNDSQPLQQDLPELLATIFDAHHAQHIIFMGASGGGFAALYYSAQFPGSLALPMNPQTSLAEYAKPSVRRYLTKAFGVENLEELPDWVVHDLTDEYRQGPENTVAYFQNLGDRRHVLRHLPPFLDATTSNHQVFTHTVDLGAGHVMADTTTILKVVNSAIEARGAWAGALREHGFLENVTANEVVHKYNDWRARNSGTV